MVTLGHIHLWHWPQQISREEYRNRASTYETFLPLIPSPCPRHLSPPPAQGIASSGSNTAAQKKTKQRLFHQLIWYFGWLHVSVMSEGHSPVCHIPAGEALGLTPVCFQHKSHPDCKSHPQKGFKSFAIIESCSAITNTPA